MFGSAIVATVPAPEFADLLQDVEGRSAVVHALAAATDNRGAVVTALTAAPGALRVRLRLVLGDRPGGEPAGLLLCPTAQAPDDAATAAVARFPHLVRGRIVAIDPDDVVDPVRRPPHRDRWTHLRVARCT